MVSSLERPSHNDNFLEFDQPLDVEGRHVKGLPAAKKIVPALATIRYAFQSLGVVYGDLGTSPLYVYKSIFPEGFADREDIMGALALITYALFLLPLLKYTFIVMRANDSGEGGSFALYSLICRHIKMKTIPNEHPTDHELTTYRRYHTDVKPVANWIKRLLEESYYGPKFLLLLALLGTSMLIGDGILNPAISVLSSVDGLDWNKEHISNDWLVVIASIILVVLFSVQRFGTDKVGWTFAPMIFLWFFCIGGIGLYNIINYDYKVLKAILNPVYIFRYTTRAKKKSWLSLGGVMLSITGTEALYADVGHFSTSSVQIAFGTYAFPCLLASYVGQAAYLSRNPSDVSHVFYRSIPGPLYWPVFLIASSAAVIASQATISATFSVIKQSVSLGCFPRVKVVHTSEQHSGQVYIPEINWILMVLCIITTAGFRGTIQIGNAYVVTVMMVTTVLMGLVMLLVWRTRLLWIILFVSFYLVIEALLFSSMIIKFDQGGWAPLAIGAISLLVMCTWHYCTLKKYEFEVQNKLPIDWILHLSSCYECTRMPGIAFVYSELTHGVPLIFSHFMTHFPAMHAVVIFICVKYLPVNNVSEEERFLFEQIGEPENCLYHCVVRYGYRELHKRNENFEDILLENLIQYIQRRTMLETGHEESEFQLRRKIELPENGIELQFTAKSDTVASVDSGTDDEIQSLHLSLPQGVHAVNHVRFTLPQSEPSENEDEQITFLNAAKYHGVVHIVGDIILRTCPAESNFLTKFMVNCVYAFLSRFCRENNVMLNIPHEALFNVGQVYYV
ncbi:hypothetical protein KP509_37G006900 [Ceratopteris richardii]|uniref:Potassium transporter n=1 Tax=Ceratopteris richardii TaxID=49495 RepID=A0A8T2Q560_CERRI|nr:hypothetical protein KP509_37G006900 [Ceratopteris richardii]